MSCEFQIMRLAYDEFQKKFLSSKIKMDYWYSKANSLFLFWLYHDLENVNQYFDNQKKTSLE